MKNLGHNFCRVGEGRSKTFFAAFFLCVVFNTYALCLEQLNPRLLASDLLLDESHGTRPLGTARASGAVGQNKKFEDGTRPDVFIEDQRAAGDWVQMGFVHNRSDWRDAGWSMIRWGIAQQRIDGSFPNGREPIFGTAFFLEAVARALLLEKQFGADNPHLEFVEPLKRGAAWVISRVNQNDPAIVADKKFGHRFWVYAAALAETSKLTNDAALLEVARKFAEAGLAVQREDGVNPEKGGFDVTYQAAGLTYAGRYASVASAEELPKLRSFLRRGLMWLKSRVTPACDIDPTGSSRILSEKDRSGQPKHVSYGLIVESFAAGSVITGDDGLRQIGRCVRNGSGFAQYGKPRNETGSP